MSILHLIDWALVAFSALWILGLSVILATLSFADYRGDQKKASIRTILQSATYQAALNGGMLLFCLGVFGSARAWWEEILWLGLASVFGYEAWRAWRSAKTKSDAPDP